MFSAEAAPSVLPGGANTRRSIPTHTSIDAGPRTKSGAVQIYALEPRHPQYLEGSLQSVQDLPMEPIFQCVLGCSPRMSYLTRP